MTRDKLLKTMATATVEHADALIVAAYTEAFTTDQGVTLEDGERIGRFLDAGALLSAAMLLLPPGCWYILAAGKTREDEPLYGAQILWRGDPPVGFVSEIIGEAEHPTSDALAFAMACVQAWRAPEEGAAP